MSKLANVRCKKHTEKGNDDDDDDDDDDDVDDDKAMYK